VGEREREPCASARSPARPTLSYESPGPSFYRRKERAQVYNGGCSNVLTCLAERSQSPKYMPSWLAFLSKKRAVQYRIFFALLLVDKERHTYHTWISII
jgi:hypothetical protein